MKTKNILNKKPSEETVNMNMMGLIRKVHGMIDNPDIEKHRHSQNQMGALFGNTKEVLIKPLRIMDMEAEWVCVDRVHMKKYVILYCHGGGYSTGSSVYARTLTSKLAASTSMDVLCFDYRLAPEHPYPSALEDAMKVWDYLMLFGYGARDIIIAGDSAGGNLALSLVLKLKAEQRLLPRGLVLLSPWTDLTSSGKSHETRKALDPVLDEAYLERMIRNYAPGEDLKNPFISPLFGDFTGFPPTYIQAGDNEILLSDAMALHKKMVKENVSVKIDIYKRMWHVFQMSPLKTAHEAMEKCAEFIYDICR
ncbi:MAG: alpha/beta hydrolase [Suilimivivens sp.]